MKTANIKLTAAIVVDGTIAPAGKVLLDVPEDHAKGLLLRGKAVLATAADEAAARAADAEADEAEAEAEGDAGEGDKPARKKK
jgi:hypothetical protein